MLPKVKDLQKTMKGVPLSCTNLSVPCSKTGVLVTLKDAIVKKTHEEDLANIPFNQLEPIYKKIVSTGLGEACGLRAGANGQTCLCVSAQKWSNKSYDKESEAVIGISLFAYAISKGLTSPLEDQIAQLKKQVTTLQRNTFKAVVTIDDLEEKNSELALALKNEDAEREKNLIKLETIRAQMAEQSATSAQEFMAVRSQLSPARARADQVSPLRRQVAEKDNEIAELKRQLEEARRMAWNPNKDEAVIKVLSNSNI